METFYFEAIKIFEIPLFFQARPGDLGKNVHACSLRFSALKVNSHPTDRALYCLLYPKSKMASAEMQIAHMRKTYFWHSGIFKALPVSAYQSLKGFDYSGW